MKTIMRILRGSPEFKKYMTGNILKYFSVEFRGTTFGYRERIRKYEAVALEITSFGMFEVNEKYGGEAGRCRGESGAID